jgi:hypothetical protein
MSTKQLAVEALKHCAYCCIIRTTSPLFQRNGVNPNRSMYTNPIFPKIKRRLFAVVPASSCEYQTTASYSLPEISHWLLLAHCSMVQRPLATAAVIIRPAGYAKYLYIADRVSKKKGRI